MLILYVAVLLVMLVLNLFLAFIIRQAVVITNRQVQAHFSRQLARGADAVDKKLEELHELETQVRKEKARLEEYRAALEESGRTAPGAEAAAGAASGTGSLFYQSGVAYRSAEALEAHRYIKDHMELDYDGLVQAALKLRRDPGRDWEVCGSILGKIGFEELFRLTTCAKESAAKELEALLTREELETLERLAPESAGLELSKRIDRVRQYRMMHDPQVRVRCADKEQDQVRHGEVITEYDPRIHEGIRLRVGAGVLDYSL